MIILSQLLIGLGFRKGLAGFIGALIGFDRSFNSVVGLYQVLRAFKQFLVVSHKLLGCLTAACRMLSGRFCVRDFFFGFVMLLLELFDHFVGRFGWRNNP